MDWFIYTLKNPRTGEVRYVGWTCKTLARRLNTHIQDAVSSPANSHRRKWILSMLAIGIRPVIELIETGSGEKWAEAEKRWIAKFRAEGARLVNATDGGEGTVGYVPRPETRARLSKAGMGRKLSPEGLARWHAAARAVNVGSKASAETRDKMSAAQKGKPKVTTHIRAYAEALKTGAVKVSPETRAKQSAIRRKRVTTDETRRRMSQAHKAFWASRSAQERAEKGTQLTNGRYK
jgi:hypothetical protein